MCEIAVAEDLFIRIMRIDPNAIAGAAALLLCGVSTTLATENTAPGYSLPNVNINSGSTNGNPLLKRGGTITRDFTFNNFYNARTTPPSNRTM